MKQYMSNKPVRFGIKVQVDADALSKYLWNFEVYCRKGDMSHDSEVAFEESRSKSSSNDKESQSGKDLGLQGQYVVEGLMKDLSGRGYIVTINNFFTLVPLFLDLLNNGIMAIGTSRAN